MHDLIIQTSLRPFVSRASPLPLMHRRLCKSQLRSPPGRPLFVLAYVIQQSARADNANGRGRLGGVRNINISYKPSETRFDVGDEIQREGASHLVDHLSGGQGRLTGEERSWEGTG